MNAEIYLLKGGSASVSCGSESFNKQMKALADKNICVLYKTAVENSEDSLKKALKLSLEDEEGIDVIAVADALEENTRENAEKFFSVFGVKKKDVRELHAQLPEKPVPEDEAENADEKADENEHEISSFSKPEDNNELRLNGFLDSEDEKGKKDKDKAEDKDKKAEERTVSVYSARVGGKKGVKMVLLPKAETVDAEFPELLYAALYKSCVTKKKSWWKNVVPIKGDKPLEVMRKSVLMVAVATFLVSGALLFNELVIKPMIADSTNSSIKDLLTEGTDDDDDDYSAVAPKKKDIVIGESEILPDFEELLNVNSDTVGWIKIPNTQIDYVVCQSSDPDDPEYYLKRDFYGNYSDYGTIFLDYRSPLDAKNLILHGHHMNDGRMFANLLYYQDLSFYKENPAFTFNTIYEKAKWKIISIYKTNTLESQGEFFNYLRGTFETESDFMNYVYQVRARSIIDCPVDVNEDDTLITLSTCAYDFDSFRFVVVARRVREGETATVDTSTATMASNPLYPDVWYQVYGGTKPVVTSFEEALAAGEIDWYDNPHDKDWTASEEQKEATEKAKQEIKEAEESSKAAENSKKLENAQTQLENAQAYLDVVKENCESAEEIYTTMKSEASSAKTASSEAYDNASSKISKATSESAIKKLISAMESAEDQNDKVIKYDFSDWKKVIDEQCDKAIEYTEAALEYSSKKAIKTEAQELKETAESYKSKIQSIVDGAEKLISAAESRNDKLESMIDSGNSAITKLQKQETSKKTESSKAAEASKKTESSKKAESSKAEESSKAAESSKVEESSTESEPESSSGETTELEEEPEAA